MKIKSIVLISLCLVACRSASTSSQRTADSGVAVEFAAQPAAGMGTLHEGDEAFVRFRITDAATGAPLTGLNPTAWIDARTGETTPKLCHDKIRAFLGGSMRTRADADLNTFYVLALNQEGNISVIDPLSGFGGSRLLTVVFLESRGADWALSADQRKLFVTMPLVNQVAVIDTASWKVVAEIDAGTRPAAIRIQPDQARVWVATEGLEDSGESGVTVIDAERNSVIRRIVTGRGEHRMAFSEDSQWAFVTNRSSRTTTIIDAAHLRTVTDVDLPAAPADIAFSKLSRAAYTACDDGSIVSIDAARRSARARIPSAPGLTTIRFTADGRWGFAASASAGAVHAIDSATDKVVERIPIDHDPDGISFTRDYAYVRCRGSENVTMIRLVTIGTEKGAELTTIPGGQIAPEYANASSLAESIVPLREGNGVLIGNPADKVIYYYGEGMAAPMGSFLNYRRQPLAVMIVDRSLREIEPSVYGTTVRLTGNGVYDVAFLLDAPRVVHCFALDVAKSPVAKKDGVPPFLVEPLLSDEKLTAGRPATLRFRVTETASGKLKSNLRDLHVLTFLAPGVWQAREWARPSGDGVYEIAITPPKPGVYFVFLECPSLHVAYRDLPHLILEARQ